MNTQHAETHRPATRAAWLAALHEFGLNLTDGRHRTSIATRDRIVEATQALGMRSRYDSTYVTAGPSQDCIYVTAQQTAVKGLVALLERAATAAVSQINVRAVPNQRLMEIAIRFWPRPEH